MRNVTLTPARLNLVTTTAHAGWGTNVLAVRATFNNACPGGQGCLRMHDRVLSKKQHEFVGKPGFKVGIFILAERRRRADARSGKGRGDPKNPCNSRPALSYGCGGPDWSGPASFLLVPSSPHPRIHNLVRDLNSLYYIHLPPCPNIKFTSPPGVG